MPNLCDYEMCVVGEKSNLEKLEKIMKYEDSSLGSLYRVFDADLVSIKQMEGNIYRGYIVGCCAWSVYCCMMEGEHCYYQGEPDGTSLLQLSKALNLKMEIFSSESGIGFQEHYFIDKGTLEINEEAEYGEFWFDEDNLTKEEIEEEMDGPITDKEYRDYLSEGYFSRGGFDMVYSHV